MIESLQRVPGLLLSNRKCESPECSVPIVLCLQLKLRARKPLKLDLQLCQSQTVFAMTSHRQIKSRFSDWSKYNTEWLNLLSIALWKECVIILHGKRLWCLHPLSKPNIKCMTHYTSRNIPVSLCIQKAALPCQFHMVGNAHCKIISLVCVSCADHRHVHVTLEWERQRRFQHIFNSNFSCMHFFFEYRAVLMHVNYPLWPSGHLPLQRCTLEHLISATNTKTVTSEKEKDHFYWEIWESISLLLWTALHCWARTGNSKYKHVLMCTLHSSFLRQTTDTVQHVSEGASWC